MSVDLLARVRSTHPSLHCALLTASTHPRVRESVSELLSTAAKAAIVTEQYESDTQVPWRHSLLQAVQCVLSAHAAEGTEMAAAGAIAGDVNSAAMVTEKSGDRTEE